MAKKSQKSRTPRQLKKHYKRLSRVCFFSEFLSVLSPYFIIGAVNYDKYFVEYNGTKVSIGFSLAMVVMGLATYLVAKKKFSNSFITLIVGWFMVTGILFLLSELLSDLSYIMLFGGIGIIGAYGLDVGSKKLDQKAEKIQKGIDIAEEQIIKEAHIEDELKRNDSRKIKIKVKKESEE